MKEDLKDDLKDDLKPDLKKDLMAELKIDSKSESNTSNRSEDDISKKMNAIHTEVSDIKKKENSVSDYIYRKKTCEKRTVLVDLEEQKRINNNLCDYISFLIKELNSCRDCIEKYRYIFQNCAFPVDPLSLTEYNAFNKDTDYIKTLSSVLGSNNVYQNNIYDSNLVNIPTTNVPTVNIPTMSIPTMNIQPINTQDTTNSTFVNQNTVQNLFQNTVQSSVQNFVQNPLSNITNVQTSCAHFNAYDNGMVLENVNYTQNTNDGKNKT